MSGVRRSIGRMFGGNSPKASLLLARVESLNYDETESYMPLEELAPKRNAITGEESLALAIVLQAMLDLTNDSEMIARSARAWVYDNNDQGLFSFKNCCALFDIDPDAARESIQTKRSPYLWNQPRRMRDYIRRPKVR